MKEVGLDCTTTTTYCIPDTAVLYCILYFVLYNILFSVIRFKKFLLYNILFSVIRFKKFRCVV